LYQGCISYEIALAAELLSKNFNIINVSPDGKDVVESSGLPLKTQASYSQISLEKCKAILVPGGDPKSIVSNTEIERILRSAHENKILIAAICAGPSILAKAGILVGRSIAHGYGPEQLEFLKDYFKGAKLTDERFIADGNILTAKPEAHIDFSVEIACRLGCVNASKSGKLKEYYKGTLGRKIRPLALAILKNSQNQFLFHKAFDNVKQKNFYRPLGGGIEFHETGATAIEREIEEELSQKVSVGELVATFENIFVYEGKKGHEIVLLFDAKFVDLENYKKSEFDIIESGKVINKAVWRRLDEILREGAKLYPDGIEKVLSK
jgi:putative intracellular protease/amidase/ADP-ribose pyrophosphatase YjhB (NUDIX family)